MPTRRTLLASRIVLAALVLLAGCAKDNPTEPTSFAISGHLQLVGMLTASNGQFLGTRVVDDANGVPVDLLSGRTVVAHTVTSHGDYRFQGLAAGSYVARSVVLGGVADSTATLTIAAHDVTAAHVLRLASAGDLYPAPNPIDARGQVTFELAEDAFVTLKVLDLGTTVVRHITSATFTAGLHSTYWDGKDDTLGVLPAGDYWITFESGTDRRAQLLFK